MLTILAKMLRERWEGSTTNITFGRVGVEVLKNLLNDTQHRCLYVVDIRILIKAMQKTVEVVM
jgi:hypothetical protein